MKGKLIIDGKDAYEHYGVLVEDGGYNGLVQWPPLKSVEITEWPDEDGVEADLSDPKLSSREFDIRFCGLDTWRVYDMIADLSDGSYHDFVFNELGITRRLRMVGQPSKTVVGDLERFSLQFADDSPLKGYQPATLIPVESCRQNALDIDGVNLSDYGVWMLEGTLDSVTRMPGVKKNLIIDQNHIEGAIYDGSRVLFSSSEMTLKLFLKTNDKTTFWNNYNRLLYDLTRRGERTLFFDHNSERYRCYYKSSAVNRFAVTGTGGLWCEFSVVFGLLSHRITKPEYLLASEDGRLITLEDSETFIDMKSYGYQES